MPSEVIHTCLVRAKMCKEIGKLQNKTSSDTGYFMTGLFSLMDSILGIPMEKILKDLPITDEVSHALKGNDNHHKQVLNLVITVKNGEWSTVSEQSKAHHIKESDVYHIYRKSLKWAVEL